MHLSQAYAIHLLVSGQKCLDGKRGIGCISISVSSVLSLKYGGKFPTDNMHECRKVMPYGSRKPLLMRKVKL
jgi:hypothetical protein